MENTIRETLKGLEIALGARKDKVVAIENKDDSELIEAKKAELQKEMDDKLNAFIADIDKEKENALAKLNRDIETIDELIGEYTAELEKIEAEKVADEETKDETIEEGTEGETNVDLAGEETIVDDMAEGQVEVKPFGNPFRP